MQVLKNQSGVTFFRPYPDVGAITEEEHTAMHSSRSNSNPNFPHSFLITPVHKIPNDSESKIVAYIGGGFAWDFALRFLLPDNVEGIIVEIKNSCNQSSLYELVGYDAFYLGENATKEPKYENMEVVRDLSFGTHPNFTSTPGHCRYTIVSNSLVHIVVAVMLQQCLTFPTTFFQTAYISQYKVPTRLRNKHPGDLRSCCSIYLCIGSSSILYL